MADAPRGIASPILVGLLFLGACGFPKNYVVLLAEKDGSVGAISVHGKEGVVAVEVPREAVALDAGGEPKHVDEIRFRKTFGAALAAVPPEPISFLLYFKSGTTTLTAKSREALPRILDTIRNYTIPEVAVVGHTDRFGPSPYNLDLARRRAEKIRDEIVSLGVDPERIDTRSHGENDPLVPTADGVHEPRNRRVSVTVR